MIARSKMIEQVIYRTAAVESISAGATTAHVSAIINRLGFNTAYFVQQQRNLTAAITSEKTVFTLYEADASTGTFTVVDSATNTMYTIPIISDTITATYATSSLMVDLSGLKQYIRGYLTTTGAGTVTSICTLTCVLGDAEVEPAV